MVVPLFMGAPLASWGTSSAVVKLAPGAPGLEYFAAAAATYFARCGKVGKAQPGTRPMDYGCAPLRLGP